MDCSDSDYLQLAEASLEDLEYSRPPNEKTFRMPNAGKLATLTALTRLVLFATHGPLQPFPLSCLAKLKELVLIDCRRLHTALFVPGALQSLQRLHIEGSEGCYYCQYVEYISEYVASAEEYADLRKAGELIVSLPQLRQVSGGPCPLLSVGLESHLSAWHVCSYDGMALEISGLEPRESKLWTKQ